MVSFSGYDELIEKVYHYKQEHIFASWDELTDNEKTVLLKDIEDIDFELLIKLFSSNEEALKKNFHPASYIPIPVSERDFENRKAAKKEGVDYIKDGKIAAFIVAGGQGSRLGVNGPKGKLQFSPVSGKTLFQLQAEMIFKSMKKYKTKIPWLIMTSRENNSETEQYFRDNNFFGLNKDDIFFFMQGTIPSLDLGGKLIMMSKNSIFKNPDGHGGSLTALKNSGMLEKLEDRGIETISYFQVDNPLVKIIDPVFIGYHVLNRAEISSKAVEKAYPDEKIGIFVEFNDRRMGIVEYSDLPKDKASQKNENGHLKYSSGNIAIHLFQREFIEKITSDAAFSLPFHTARKKIKAYTKGACQEIDGLKFEKFVFDAIPLTENNVIYETIREEEFAPIKNPSGVDSAESASSLMSMLHRKWLEKKGIKIPDEVKIIEISPKLAIDPEDIDKDDIKIPAQEKVYLE